MTQVQALVEAYDTFIVGCKSDGIWDAIKASCIMAGWDGLSGALTPLVGTAPTNNNFVAGDYNRTTGLVGDGSTKYLDSNRNNNADPQNDKHISVYVSGSFAPLTCIGAWDGITATGATWIARDATSTYYRMNAASSSAVVESAPSSFVGISRISSTSITIRRNSASQSQSQTSATPQSFTTTVFSQGTGGNFTSSRLSFYSIGESLDLALLDSRVTTLMADIAAAIP